MPHTGRPPFHGTQKVPLWSGGFTARYASKGSIAIFFYQCLYLPLTVNASAENMSIDLVVETGVPLPDSPNYFDLKVKADAACKTAELLKAEAGQNIDLSEDSVNELEKEIVASLAEGYAADPEKASKALNQKRTAQMSPASMVMVSKILGEFGNLVVNNSVEIRNLVTNKLLIETENEDPKVRIRALELLGKISDVGLFSEKHEYTVTHRTTDELRESLREKLKKFSSTDDDVQDAVDADFTVVD